MNEVDVSEYIYRLIALAGVILVPIVAYFTGKRKTGSEVLLIDAQTVKTWNEAAKGWEEHRRSLEDEISALNETVDKLRDEVHKLRSELRKYEGLPDEEDEE